MENARKRGRPFMPDGTRKSEEFRIVCTPAESAILKAAAKDTGSTISQVVRMLIFSKGGVSYERNNT